MRVFGLSAAAVCVGSMVLAAGAPGQMADQGGGIAQQPKRLEPGEPAPALDIAEWMKGEPVKEFEKGRAYVVEFWATWCGPCRAGIPKLTALQQKYADKKLTVISVSVDQGGADVVRKFVDKNGARMGYTVALDKGGTSAGYMQASGVGGIPHSFVIDTNGKMVWHGNPVVPTEGLELVVEEVVNGTFDIKKNEERQRKFGDLDQRYAKAAQELRWDDAEKLLDEIVAIRPDLTANLAITHLWIKTQTPNNDAKVMAYAKQVADKELKDEGEMLAVLADKLLGLSKLSADDQAFVTSVARRAVDKTKRQNATALIVLSEALKREGKLDDAIAAAQGAADATIEPLEQKYYQDKVSELKGMKK